MKKILARFLAFLYLLPATGFSMGMHVCGHKITAVRIASPGSDDCSCEAGMKNDCCRNIHLVFKITGNQNAASEISVPNHNFSSLVFESTLPARLFSGSQPVDFEFPRYHEPPPDGKRPVYLSNRVFRI